MEPSILSADFLRLGEQAKQAEKAGVDALQVDIMDGRFVPNITFGPNVVQALRGTVRLPLDIHLMILKPERYLRTFADAGADRLIVHQEASEHLKRILRSIKKLKLEAGVAINPDTALRVLDDEVLDLADLIQVMTVNPGFGGQEFIRGQLVKIRQLRRVLDDRRFNIPIAVDGGINTSTAPLAVRYGASVLVAGSSIFNGKASVAQNVTALRKSITRKGGI
ncbi:MAG: ribulose-phosphate 3-epimerase [Candidatus Bathyarchaeia archaeon]